MNNEIKIGTKIKALVDFPDGGGVKKGEVGVIIDAERDIAIADFPSQKNYYISYSYFGNGYEIVSETEITNTFGLKVGDELPVKIINKWSMQGLNYYGSKKRWESESFFSGNRKILSFKLLDDILGFEVSETGAVYLKAEGFKEFMDNFEKKEPEFEVSKWYRTKKGKGFGKYKSSLSGDYLHKCMKKASSPIKEIEELPEHWCFKVTPENYKKFQHLRSLVNSIAGGYITSSKYSPKGWGHFYTNKPSGYIEIPFELFEKHYLYQQLPPHLVAAQIEDKLADFSDLRIGYCPSKDAESILSIKTTTKPKLTIIDIPTTQPIVIKLNKKIKYLIPKSI